jgi:DNA-directed RNA polymerase subunit RPC12/RpoP
MDLTRVDRQRCHAPRCGRSFAFVYRRSWRDVPVPMAVACPYCGSWEVVEVPTGAVRVRAGAYVLPLSNRAAALAS